MENKGLKKLEQGVLKFEANGKTYVVESTLSVNRYIEYQQLEIQAGMGVDFAGMIKGIDEVIALLNKVQFVDAAIKLNNLRSGVLDIPRKEPNLLKLCALFINEENEDRATITSERISQKIEDWGEYEAQGFFALALTSINGFIDIYKQMHQAFTE